MYENVLAAFPPHLSSSGNTAWQREMATFWTSVCKSMVFGDHWTESINDIKKEQARLFSHDLAHAPLRFIGLPREMIARRAVPWRKHITLSDDAQALLPQDIMKGLDKLATWIRFKDGIPPGLMYATRPFGLIELGMLIKDPFDPKRLADMKSVMWALRGFEPDNAMPHKDKKGVLHVPSNDTKTTQTIAVSSWSTTIGSWTASVTHKPDPDLGRYARLNQLVNQLIAQPRDTDYLILPELALPARWFTRLARKLQGRGISLLAGIEYQHGRGARVRNQVWAALTHDGLGFPSAIIYRQDKQRPAPHEEAELWRVAGKKLVPLNRWKGAPPVIQHGDFRFAMLVCSELTNIQSRSALRGKVDALFVPEWNQDTETFRALVESAALDIHAYIIQCNDRAHGDSRIRAPNKDSWRRDVLRVKGGINDYYVIGKIDVQALRRFQSGYRSLNGPFKPVPDGFEIDHARETLPTEVGK